MINELYREATGKFYCQTIAVLFFVGFTPSAKAQQSLPKQLVDYVQPLIGVLNNGACMPGPALPFASVYPSPNTIKADNGGYAFNEPITGFAQLHAQGTGGIKPYGNFLISPQVGLRIKEAAHQSLKEEEFTSACYYKVRLKKYGVLAELAPAANSVLYRFTFPASDSAIVLLDIARKNGADQGLDSGSITVSADGKSMYGGGTYANNWPDAKKTWKMYFYAEFDIPVQFSGTFSDSIATQSKTASSLRQPLGAYAGFKTKLNQSVIVKIAISFISWEHARTLLHTEIPAWNLETLKNEARQLWNDKLSTITIEGTEDKKTIFYTNLFHSFIQPRNRTGNNEWNTAEEFWDDHYTLWDSWKTLFPLMGIIDQKMVASNIRAFINRHKHNGYVTEAFVNGKENAVGQGGNTVDNVIADAYVRKIPGVDWQQAYQIIKYNADSMRTPAYRNAGFMYYREPNQYSWRIYAGSSTLAFSFNDYCAAVMAKGLGKQDDYQRYEKRSHNWKNNWNSKAASDGFTGFIMARKKDGAFDEIDPKAGYYNQFYEGSCWEYSYEIPHDIKAMVDSMGGKAQFVKRLQHAINGGLIDFGNEPSFMTPWLFANEAVGRPDLTSFYINTKLLPLYTRYDLPGDDDQGAMGSMYVFLKLGFFPFAGTNKFYLHGTTLPKITIHPLGGKPFTIMTKNGGDKNFYIQSVWLNGRKLNRTYITQEEIMAGGVLQFVMTNKQVNFSR